MATSLKKTDLVDDGSDNYIFILDNQQVIEQLFQAHRKRIKKITQASFLGEKLGTDLADRLAEEFNSKDAAALARTNREAAKAAGFLKDTDNKSGAKKK